MAIGETEAMKATHPDYGDADFVAHWMARLGTWEWYATEDRGNGLFYGFVQSPHVPDGEWGSWTERELSEAGAGRTLDRDLRAILPPDGWSLRSEPHGKEEWKQFEEEAKKFEFLIGKWDREMLEHDDVVRLTRRHGLYVFDAYLSPEDVRGGIINVWIDTVLEWERNQDVLRELGHGSYGEWIAKERGFWEKYERFAADRYHQLCEGHFSKGSVCLDEFLDLKTDLAVKGLIYRITGY